MRKVNKAFGNTDALRDFDLDVKDGETLVITGASGTGKTTLLRLIAGLEQPDAGDISLNGVLVSSPEYRLAPHLRNIGFVMQNPALWPHLNVRQHLQFVLGRMNKNEATEKINKLLAGTGLEKLAGRLPAKLSGGEARRLSIARALAASPSILLLDEPLVHLDRELRTQMLELIQFNAEACGATTIHVSHHLDEVVSTADRVISLN